MPVLLNGPLTKVNTNEAGYATPQTPGQISGATQPKGITLSGPLTKVQPAQTTQPTEPAYTGQVEKESPLSFWQRLKLSFGSGDKEGQKNALQNMGLETLQDTSGNVLIKKGDKVYNVDEPGFSIKDIADIAGGATPIAGALVGGLAGSIAAPVTGGASIYAGGAAGAGLGETARQLIGKKIGVREEGLSTKDIGLQTLGGGLGMAGAGKGAQILGKVFGPTIAKKLGLQVGAGELAGKFATQGGLKGLGGRVLAEGTEGAIGGGIQSGAVTGIQTEGDVGETLKATGVGALTGFGLGSALGTVLPGGKLRETKVKVPETKPETRDTSSLRRRAEAIADIEDKMAANPKYKPTPEETDALEFYKGVTTNISSAEVSDYAKRVAVIEASTKPTRGGRYQDINKKIEDAFKNPSEENAQLRKEIETRAKNIEKKITKAGGISNFEKTNRIQGDTLQEWEDLLKYLKTGEEPTGGVTPKTPETIAEPSRVGKGGPVATLAVAPAPTVTSGGRFFAAPEVGVFIKETPDGFNLAQITTDKELFLLSNEPGGRPKTFKSYEDAARAIDDAPGLEAQKEYWQNTAIGNKDADILLKETPSEHLEQTGETFSRKLSQEELDQFGKEGGTPSDILETGEVIGSNLTVTGGLTPMSGVYERALTRYFEKVAAKMDGLSQKEKNAAYLSYKRATAVNEILANKTITEAFEKFERELFNTADNTLGLKISPDNKISFADYIVAKLAENKSGEGDVVFRVVRDTWKETKFNQLIKKNFKWATAWDNATPKDIEPYVWAVLKRKGIPNPDMMTTRADFNAWQIENLPTLQKKGLESKSIVDALGVLKSKRLTGEEAAKLAKIRATFGDDVLWSKYKKPEFIRFGDVPGGKYKKGPESTFIEGQKQDRAFLREVLGPEKRYSGKQLTVAEIEEAITIKNFKKKWAHLYKKSGETPRVPVAKETSLTPDELRAQIDPEGQLSDSEFLIRYAQEGGFNSPEHFLNKINKLVREGEEGTGSFADRIRGMFSDEQIKQGWEMSQKAGADATLATTAPKEPTATLLGGPEDKVPARQKVDEAVQPTDQALREAAAAQRGETPPIDQARQARIEEIMKTLSNPSGKGDIPSPKTAKSRVRQFVDTLLEGPRTLMSSFDISAQRQNIFGIAARPSLFKKSFGEQLKSLTSEANFKEATQRRLDNRFYSDAEKYGLAVKAQEEAIPGVTTTVGGEKTFWEKWFPGVRASARAFDTATKNLRMDYFEFMADKAIKAGRGLDEITSRGIPLGEELASYINLATGRGTLSKGLERYAPLLNNVFFSPRLLLSRLTLLNPLYYVKADPMVRQEALRGLLSMGAGATAVLTLASVAGLADVETDPRSTDFAKLKIGKTRIDILGGFQQYLRAAAQLTTGEIKSSKGRLIKLGKGYKPMTRKDVLFNFFENKEAPVMSFVNTLLEGQDFQGKPLKIPKEIADRFTPMMMQDLIEIYKEDPSLIPVGLLGGIGAGVQTY